MRREDHQRNFFPPLGHFLPLMQPTSTHDDSAAMDEGGVPVLSRTESQIRGT